MPAQAEHDADAPKIGAPRLANLEKGDPRRKVMENELRKYFRYRLAIPPKGADEAAQLVGKSRTTFERYRETWPEIEAEVQAELAAKADKVRKA